MKLILVSVFIMALFSACSCKPKTIKKLVYIDKSCPKIPIFDYNNTTNYSDINISYEVIYDAG